MIITSIKRHAVYHARDVFIFPVALETPDPLFSQAPGRRSAPPSQGCGWMGIEPSAAPCPWLPASTRGVDLPTILRE